MCCLGLFSANISKTKQKTERKNEKEKKLVLIDYSQVSIFYLNAHTLLFFLPRITNKLTNERGIIVRGTTYHNNDAA